MSSAEQLALEGMPRRLFSCTPSRLAAFDCPRRYRFTYLDRPTPPRGPAWAHNTVGAVAHLALAAWWGEPAARRTPQRGAELVERNWAAAGFRDEQQSDSYRGITSSWVRRYLADVDPAHDPVGVERTVGVPVGNLALSGRIDRIDERAGELVVVDYKTGRRGVTEQGARTSQPLALYVLAARRSLRRDCHRVELHHIPTGDVAVFEHTGETLARHVARAEATAADIQAAVATMDSGAHPDDVFPAAVGPGCSWCDFRPSCPEGRAAAPQLDPWAGLAEPAAEVDP